MRRLALLAALGLVLTGCARSGGTSAPTPSASPRSHFRTIIHSPLVLPLRRKSQGGPDIHHFAQFLSPTRLAIVTWGSGSCPAVPDKLVVRSPRTLRIHLAVGSYDRRHLVAHPPRPNGICTDDLTTTPMVIRIDPRQIDVRQRLTIQLYYYGGKKPQVVTAPPL